MSVATHLVLQNLALTLNRIGWHVWTLIMLLLWWRCSDLRSLRDFECGHIIFVWPAVRRRESSWKTRCRPQRPYQNKSEALSLIYFSSSLNSNVCDLSNSIYTAVFSKAACVSVAYGSIANKLTDQLSNRPWYNRWYYGGNLCHASEYTHSTYISISQWFMSYSIVTSLLFSRKTAVKDQILCSIFLLKYYVMRDVSAYWSYLPRE